MKKIYDKSKSHLKKSIKQGFKLSYFVYARLQYEIFKKNDGAFQAAEGGKKRDKKYSKFFVGFAIAHGKGTKKDFNKYISILLESEAENLYDFFFGTNFRIIFKFKYINY